MSPLQWFSSLSSKHEGISENHAVCAGQNPWPLRVPGHPCEGHHGYSNFTASVDTQLSSSAPQEDAYVFGSG